MSRLIFYLTYAFRNIQRGGRWTTLAILCITAGVATVVALRSLGLAISDSLVDNVRIETKGDMLVRKGSSGGFSFRSTLNPNRFSDYQLNAVIDWVDDHDGTMSAFMIGSNVQVAALDFDSIGRPSFIDSFFIDPDTYPPTHEVIAIDPSGVPLAELFTGGNDVVVSDNLASLQGIKVGDQVRVSQTEEPYTVRGIVPTTSEARVTRPLSGFFGFVYFDLEQAQQAIDPDFAPNQIGIVLPGTPTREEILTAEDQLRRITGGRVTSAFDVLDAFSEVSQIMGDFIVVLALGALLIGGVGIMNTMLVLVRRRTNEIAAVKTFGLKGRQVALLFLTEALMLGIIGSVIGSIVGILLTGIVNRYGEAFLQQPLPWRIYPEALVYGLVLGMVVTAIFGVVPVLAAVKVRPATILRPNETVVGGLGIVQSLLMMVFVTISIGLIVGQIVSPSFAIVDDNLSRLDTPSPYLVGVLAVGSTLLVIGILIGLLWILVWLVGKFPTFGSVTLRLALRNMSTHRLRTATTLLALTAGMFALSSITFVGQGARELLNLRLASQFGGNVVSVPFPLIPPAISRGALNVALTSVEGVTYQTTLSLYDARITAVDGTRQTDTQSKNVVVWDTDNPTLDNANIIAGRRLTLEDRGQYVMVLPQVDAIELGAGIGSMIEFSIDGQHFIYETVGLMGDTALGFGPSPDAMLPPETIGAANPSFIIYTLMVEEEHLNEALVALSTVPIAFSIDITFIDSLLSRLIDQFAAIPTIVGLLSLLAAAVIMANTVALSTLERQRQIGILKAIGLKARRVLVIMLIETSIIGLLSAVLGIGLSSLGVALFTALGGTSIPLPADARLTAVALVIAAVVISAVATFLSARSAIHERVMNILRYE